MRVPVDMPTLKRAAPQMGCPSCRGVISRVATRQNSVIWYCSRCDVYHEVTPRGVGLRSFKKEADQIINLPVQENQP